MKQILQALYDGEIAPAEQYRPKTKEYARMREKYVQHYEEWIQKLEKPLDAEFEHMMEEQLDIVALELTQMFLDGFRLGARMMMEVYEDEVRNLE